MLDDDVATRILASHGSALGPPIRRRMESAFGADFSNVRVHRDSAIAPRIQASAFTLGEDIHFAPGHFQPEPASNDRLVAHELAHVLQQRAGGASETRVSRFFEGTTGAPAIAAAGGRQAAHEEQEGRRRSGLSGAVREAAATDVGTAAMLAFDTKTRVQAAIRTLGAIGADFAGAYVIDAHGGELLGDFKKKCDAIARDLQNHPAMRDAIADATAGVKNIQEAVGIAQLLAPFVSQLLTATAKSVLSAALARARGALPKGWDLNLEGYLNTGFGRLVTSTAEWVTSVVGEFCQVEITQRLRGLAGQLGKQCFDWFYADGFKDAGKQIMQQINGFVESAVTTANQLAASASETVQTVAQKADAVAEYVPTVPGMADARKGALENVSGKVAGLTGRTKEAATNFGSKIQQSAGTSIDQVDRKVDHIAAQARDKCARGGEYSEYLQTGVDFAIAAYFAARKVRDVTGQDNFSDGMLKAFDLAVQSAGASAAVWYMGGAAAATAGLWPFLLTAALGVAACHAAKSFIKVQTDAFPSESRTWAYNEINAAADRFDKWMNGAPRDLLQRVHSYSNYAVTTVDAVAAKLIPGGEAATKRLFRPVPELQQMLDAERDQRSKAPVELAVAMPAGRRRADEM